MKTSCIQHPNNEPLIIIRLWQRAFCRGNTCAAALLSFYEYWHNIKKEMRQKNVRINDVAQLHGDERTQDETFLQYHSMEELMEGIQQLYAKTAIREANQLLVSLGALSIHKNPNPKYTFDKTYHYQFHPEVCNAWLKERSGNETPPYDLATF